MDNAKLEQLSNLIKSCQALGEINTIENWYKFKYNVSTIVRKKIIPPPYSGGPVIVFRIDDLAKGWHENVIQEIIKILRKMVSQ